LILFYFILLYFTLSYKVVCAHGFKQESFATLGKPVMVTEFGKRDKNPDDMRHRSTMLSAAFDDMYQSTVNNLAFRGALFWMFAGDNMPDYGAFNRDIRRRASGQRTG
jgi:hypothetical protein